MTTPWVLRAIENSNLDTRAEWVVEDLISALDELIQFSAEEIGVPVEECVAGPIGEARQALDRALNGPQRKGDGQ